MSSLQVQAASVLFVDNPVGTGFSYTERPDGYATNVAMVASDMLVLLTRFFSERAEFQVSWRPAGVGPEVLLMPVLNMSLFPAERPLLHLL